MLNGLAGLTVLWLPLLGPTSLASLLPPSAPLDYHQSLPGCFVLAHVLSTQDSLLNKMPPSDQDYPRKPTMRRRANGEASTEGSWWSLFRCKSLLKIAHTGCLCTDMEEPGSETTSNSTATSTRSSRFSAPSPFRDESLVNAIVHIVIPPNDFERSSYPPLRLRSRALPSELDSGSLSPANANESPSSSQIRSSPQKAASPTTLAANRDRQSPSAQPKAQAVVTDSTSPFWSNAGGIFQPDAQNPMPVSSSEVQALQQLPISVNRSVLRHFVCSKVSLIFDLLQSTVGEHPYFRRN